MTCHPAYFSLNYDELLLGEGVSEKEFRERYQATAPLRQGNELHSGGKVGGVCEANPERIPPHSQESHEEV